MSAKRQLLKYISATLLCLGVFSTVTYANSAPKSLKGGVSPTWAVLGAPTLYTTGMPTSTIICVDTTNSTVGSNPQAGFTLNSSVSGIELNSVLNLGVKAELPKIESYGGLNANLNASFSANAKNTEYSYNYTYLYTYSSEATFPIISYGDTNLSPSGKAAREAGLEAFMNTCGDSYVSSLRAGTVLAVDVKVTFQNKEEAESFFESAAAGGYGALGGITTYISSSQLAKNAVMSISAMQLGGTPESLNQILGYDSTTGGYYATACGVANSPAACQKTIDAILLYANTLSTQISGGTNLYFFNPVLGWYSKLGISVPDPQALSAETQAAQSSVINQINLSQSRIIFLSNYKQNSLPLQADVKTYIDKQIHTLQARIDYINSAAVDCFNANAETCPRIVGEITQRIKSTPDAFGFSKDNYNKLNSAWYYTYGNRSTYIVPVSLFGAYATIAGTTDNPLDKPGLAATVYSAQENGVSYVTQFDIPDIDFLFWGSYNTCLPASNDDKFATTRNFICRDGIFNTPTPVQFIATTNPI